MDPNEAQLYSGQVFTTASGSYLLGALIGSGGFGGVFEATDQTSGEEVAVKVLAFNGRPPNAHLEFDDEIALLAVLTGCSNVVTLLGSGIHDVHLTSNGLTFPVQVPYMVLDRAAVGLESLLAQRHQISWLDRLRLYRDLVKGCHQMHLKRLVHRDVKAANCLVYDADPHGRITDLGRSKDTRQTPRLPAQAYFTGRGDLRFAPPELLWGLGETSPDAYCRGDLYLLGSLLYEFAAATGITAAALADPRPWIARAAGLGDQSARERDYRAHLAFLGGQYEPTYTLFEHQLPKLVSKDAGALLRQLTDADPAKREPKSPVRGLPVRWDLQWLMYRVDIFIKRLEIEERRGLSGYRGRRNRKAVKTP